MQACQVPGERLPNTIAVAVSGGADSMALALLAHDWGRANGLKVVALTVDHDLRPEAADEARQVGLWLRGRGIDHHILNVDWGNRKPETRVQERARALRYELMGAWCAANGGAPLLVAHHMEDQAETVLMRMRKCSGLMGLAGMRRCHMRGQLHIVRPLLPVSKARLITTLEERNQDWVEDPSNFNMAFERVRTRALLQHLAPEGVDAVRLAQTAQALGRLRDILDGAVDDLLAATQLDDAPTTLDCDKLCAAPSLLVNFTLGRILKRVGALEYGPDTAKLERLTHWVYKRSEPSARTLSGCEVRRATRGGRAVLEILPEGPRRAVQKEQKNSHKTGQKV